MPNIHNDFFHHCFGHKEAIAGCMQCMLPEEVVRILDLTTLVPEKTDFLPSKYRNNRRVDSLWSIKTRQGTKILLHVEHQSTSNKLIAIQLLEYMADISRVYYVREGLVPPIFPLVVYHRARKWEGPKSIAEIYSDAGIHLRSGFFETFLWDLTQYPLAALQKHGSSSLPEIVLAVQPTGGYVWYLEEGSTSIKKL